MPVIAAAAATAFAAVSSAVAATAATLTAIGTAISAGATALGISGVVSAAMTALKVLSVASSIYSLTRKPKSSAGSPSPIAFKADPNAAIQFIAGEAATGGNIVFAQTHAPKNRFVTYITALSHGGPVKSIGPFTAADEVVTFTRDNNEGASGRYQDRMWMKFGLGAVGAAALLMTSTATKYTPARAGNLVEWTANHKLSGIAHTMYSLWSDVERLPNGVPKPLWVVHGGPVYDPRKDSTMPGGVGPQRWNDRTTWSHDGNENPFLQGLTFLIGHYFNGVRFGGAGVPISGIDVPSFVQGANVADANGWKISYPWNTGMRKWDVLATMLQAGGGRPIARGAKISCIVQTPRVSIGTITEADLVADFSTTGSQTVRDRKNAIIPRCRMPSLKWTVQPFGKVTNAAYLAEDGGEERPREIDYESVKASDGGKQVRQLAAYDLAALREGIVATMPLTIKHLRYRAGDCLTIDAPETLLNGQKVIVIKREFDPTALTVTLTVQSETDAKHAFCLGQTDAPPPSPALTGVDPLVLQPPAPTAWEVEPGVSPGGGGGGTTGTAPVIIVRPAPVGTGGNEYTGSDDEPAARSVLIRYRRAGIDPVTGLPYEWAAPQEFPLSDSGYEVTGLAPGVLYQVEIAYKARGVTSAWTDYGTVQTGDLVATDTENVAGRAAADILADLDAVPGIIDDAVAGLELALNDLWATLETPTTGVFARLGTLEVTTADLEAGKADASRVTALEATVNTPGTGLTALVAALEVATADLETGKADASRVSLVEARVSSAEAMGIFPNETFSDWPGVVNDPPTNWSKAEAGSAVISRVVGQGRPFAARMSNLLNSDTTALFTPYLPGLSGYYVLEAEYTLVSGVLDGAALVCRGDWAGGYVNEGYMYLNGASGRDNVAADFAANPSVASDGIAPGAGVAGRTYRMSKLIRLRDVGANPITQVRMFVFGNGINNYSGAGGADAKDLTVHRARMRPATATEIELREARANFSSVAARVASVETATVDLATGKADASRVALIEARASGANLLSRSVFPTGTAQGNYAPWTFAPTYPLADPGVWPYNNSWSPLGLRALAHAIPTGVASGQYSEWQSEPIPIDQNKRYCAAALSGLITAGGALPNDVNAYVFMYMCDANGTPVNNTISYNLPGDRTNAHAARGGPQFSDYKQLYDFTSPTGFHTADFFGANQIKTIRVVLRIARVAGGSLDYVYAFWNRIGLYEVPLTATQAPPWSDVAATARLTQQETASADLYGRTQARWQLGAAVPGATAFIEALAETTPGATPTSSVAIGARQVAIYNVVGGEYKKALEVQNGNVVLSGGLTATGFIRLGNGVGWPIARATVPYSLSDGDVVAFGTDLGALPFVSFGLDNLAPLTTGETYNLYAESLTATGFTFRAKINVPGAPTNNSLTGPGTAVTIAGYPGRFIARGALADTASGNYRLRATGTQEHYVQGTGGVAIDGNEDSVDTDLNVYALKGGSWVLVGNTSVNTVVDPDSLSTAFQTVNASWALDQVVNVGTGATQIAIVRVAATNGRTGSVTSFTNLDWQSAAAPSSVRSATPAGQKTTVSVRPQ